MSKKDRTEGRGFSENKKTKAKLSKEYKRKCWQKMTRSMPPPIIIYFSIFLHDVDTEKKSHLYEPVVFS